MPPCPALAALLTLLAHATAAAEPEPIPVEIALEAAREAYRAGPVADRVVVSFEDAQGRRATDQLVVRIHADPPGDSPIVALDLGRLHVAAAAGRLVAVHDAEATTCWTVDVPDPVTPDAIQRHLPPLPVPQLALALDLALRPELTTPYTPDLRWRAAAIDQRARPPVITLEGRAATGPVTAALDADTGRLRRLEAAIDADGATSRIKLQCTAIDPGDSASWIPQVGARRRVERLGDLTQRPHDLGPGDAAPDVKALTLELASWSLHEAVGIPPDARPVAVLAFRVAPPGVRADQIRRDVLAGAAALAEALRLVPLPALRAHPVAVVDLSEVELDRIRELERHWTESAAHEQIDPSMRWTASAAHAIDAFDPGADAILLLVGRDLRIAGVVPLDARADDPDGLAEAVADRLDAIRPEADRPRSPQALPRPIDEPPADRRPDAREEEAQREGGPPKDPPLR